MITTRTPFRISFVGGGSDMEAFYKKYQGAVLSTSINKYMYISTHKYFHENKVRVKYSETETVDNINKLKHPIFKETLKLTGINKGIEISSIADIPSGTGMGSSSSFTVGLLHNLNAVNRKYITKDELAETACKIEIDILKEPIGKQDQYAAAFGGLNIIRFNPDDSVKIEPLYIKNEVSQKLEDNLLMFYTGNKRKASDILTEQKRNISETDKFEGLKSMTLLVSDLRDALFNENLKDFGKILHENWILKQKLASKISNNKINKTYDIALKNGAIGGKLLGAGGGGFLLFYAEKEHHQRLKYALRTLRHFDFKFDKDGSKLISYTDE